MNAEQKSNRSRTKVEDQHLNEVLFSDTASADLPRGVELWEFPGKRGTWHKGEVATDRVRWAA